MFNSANVYSMEGLNNEKFKIIEMRTKKHRAHKAFAKQNGTNT